MNIEHKNLLDKFLKTVAGLTVSIMLTGSHVDGNATKGSDIDLIVVTLGTNEAGAVKKCADKLNKTNSQFLLDCKIYTKQEFLASQNGIESLFLLTCLLHGKILSGHDITKNIKLNSELVLNSIWRCVQNTEESCERLKMYNQFTGCCYHLYNALATVYYVNRFVLKTMDKSTTKCDFISTCLDDQYFKVRDRYFWVARKNRCAIFADTLKVPTSIDKRFKKSDYLGVHKRSLDVLDLVQKNYCDVSIWIAAISK
jgi:predicted nucleotidyltransferase